MKKRKVSPHYVYKKVIKVCENCQEPFVTTNKDTKFCCAKCEKIYASDAAFSKHTQETLLERALKGSGKARNHLDSVHKWRKYGPVSD